MADSCHGSDRTETNNAVRSQFSYCSQRSSPSLSDSMVLVSRTAAYADRTHDLAALLQRNPAGEDHDAAIIGGVDSEKLASGLAVRSQVLGGNIESPGGIGFLY